MLITLELGTAQAGENKMAAIVQLLPVGTGHWVKCRLPPLLFERECQYFQIKRTGIQLDFWCLLKISGRVGISEAHRGLDGFCLL